MDNRCVTNANEQTTVQRVFRQERTVSGTGVHRRHSKHRTCSAFRQDRMLWRRADNEVTLRRNSNCIETV